MSDMIQDKPMPTDITSKSPARSADLENTPSLVKPVPWLIQQFFSDQNSLAGELVARFPNPPLMSVIRIREQNDRRGVASMTTADNVASLMVNADGASGVTEFAFTYASATGMRFSLNELSDMDRARWLELMRHEETGAAFLWGQKRWGNDYIICVTKRQFANLYAFSHSGFEAAARLTPEVCKSLLDWLQGLWGVEAAQLDDTQPRLDTW
jgi:hypothetical protein